MKRWVPRHVGAPSPPPQGPTSRQSRAIPDPQRSHRVAAERLVCWGAGFAGPAVSTARQINPSKPSNFAYRETGSSVPEAEMLRRRHVVIDPPNGLTPAAESRFTATILCYKSAKSCCCDGRRLHRGPGEKVLDWQPSAYGLDLHARKPSGPNQKPELFQTTYPREVQMPFSLTQAAHTSEFWAAQIGPA